MDYGPVDFGYYFPLIANSTENYEWRDMGLAVVTGANQIWQLDRDRKKYNGAATCFLDTKKGSHTFKSGVELLQELAWEGCLHSCGGVGWAGGRNAGAPRPFSCTQDLA